MSKIEDAKAREIIKNLDIESSYSINDLGTFLYDTVLEYKPTKIVEFGTLYGYSAICMGLALKALGRGSMTCYDLWEEYPYKHSRLADVQHNIERYSVCDVVTLKKGDLFSENWSDLDFDFCHIDVSNDGDKIEKAYNIFRDKIVTRIPILFEGGSDERDAIAWMTKYNKSPIAAVKNHVHYGVVNSKFPSISMFF